MPAHRRIIAVVLIGIWINSIGATDRTVQEYSSDEPGFAQFAQPFLKKHCVRCHEGEKPKGELRIGSMLPNRFLDPTAAAKWAEVVNVINSHEMPPEDEPQPTADEAARFVDWVTAELGRAETAKRSTNIVLRRMNRSEYNNTIRDLVGINFQPANKFPEDPPAAGFDNIGQALTLSPLQLELYYQAARQILDRAMVEGDQPPVVKWRFEPEENTQGGDRLRVKRDGNNILLNDGNNPTENGFTVIHHNSWDKGVGFRDFKFPHAGDYIIRFRAAGRIPSREKVVESARAILAHRRDEQLEKNPKGKEWHDKQFEKDLEHFALHRMYDYGPPRVKISIHLAGQPLVVAEMDVAAPEAEPQVYEVVTRFTTESAGVGLEYAYDIPKVLENFWLQSSDKFARPELLIDWIEMEGPIHATWPPLSHQRILPSAKNDAVTADEIPRAREVLKLFMRRAYRRPVTAEEIDGKLMLFQKVRAEKPSFVEAIKTPLAAVLTSPHFLFLTEPHSAAESGRPLTTHELAARLSYFLWSSMPDDELFRLAAKGELAKPDVLRQQADRMLADPKREAFVKNFTGQWLGLRKVGSNPPSSTLYPEYDRHLETSSIRETETFFAEILQHDLDARNLLRSDFVTINERLARFYDLPNVRGDHFRRVVVTPEAHRGGVVTQASILSITSNGTRTSPVSRGVWVLRTLLGTDPGLPVANAGEIAPKVPGIDKATVRQRLQIHRELPQCARCHNKIDPLGFALENFNACGEWRDREGHGYNGRIEKNDPIIDASARMPDGTEITGVSGLQAELLKKEDLFLTALAEKMFTYALGRELGFSDRPMLRRAVAAMKDNGYTLRSLVHDIVASPSFNSR